ncbi:MAG TPA: adenosylcobinamide-phosphate synthase CbiB [Rhodospirillales bacterium]|nr:adenosylcobinamide-phosphate synthase CbiB [Rhodospirillales bacterium]
MPIPLSPGAAVSHLLLLLAALAVDAAIGGRPGPFAVLPHPVRLIGALIAWLERRLNHAGQGGGDKQRRGVLAVLIVCGLCGAIGWGVTALARQVPAAILVELALVVSLLAQRSLFDHVRAVARALRGGGVEAGRTAVGHIVGRDVRVLDEHGVARAAIESCAENFSDGVVAPVFWYALAGLPGLLVYKAANTLDSMIGHRSERYLAFGWAAARLDDLLNLIPARLAALLLAAAAALMPAASGRRALTVMRRDARGHRSPNAGWPEAAAAGALGLALGGPRRYGDDVVSEPWLGDGGSEANAEDIERMLRLYLLACLLQAAVVGAVALA